MKYIFLLLLFIATVHDANSQKDCEIGLRLGFTLHNMNIDEDDNGLFFLAEQELIPYYEVYLKKSLENFDIEAGLGVLLIDQLLTTEFTNNNIEFPIYTSSGESFSYVAFPIRLKKEFHLNSWLGISPGIELTSAYLFDSMIFSTESRSCTVLNNSIRSCTILRLHESAQFTTGLGINSELNIKIMDRLVLGIFGFRNWRIGKGWTVDITKEYEDKSGNIIESRQGSGRPSLSTWNMGLKISILW